MSEVVLGVHPTVHAAYPANQAPIRVSTTALYNKLDRVETALSAALVHDSAVRAEPVVKALGASHPRWVPGYQITVLDGTHLSATEHRLKDLRGTWAAPWPGQALGVLDHQRMLLTDVMLREDGHAQERSVIPAVLQRVEAEQRWSEDRTCCPLGLLFGMARRGAVCVVRQHRQRPGERLGRAQRTGTTRSGPVYAQARPVRDPATGETMRLRRITIQRKVATRDGDTERHILSHVPSGRGAAAHLARVYGKRWSIETAFFAIPTTLACEIKTLGYPKAALFPFCLALLADNAVSVIKAALRSAHGRQKIHDEVSSDYVSLEIGRTSDGMMVALPAPHGAFFRARSARAFADA